MPVAPTRRLDDGVRLEGSVSRLAHPRKLGVQEWIVRVLLDASST